MKHPLWKKLLSYVTEISLVKTGSYSNPYLEVLLTNGRHQLVTADAIYSYDDKYENFNHAFKNIDWDNFKGQKVLLLGLGLGSVILLLEKHFHRLFDYTAVEVDSEICKLCYEYTLKDLNSFVEVIPREAMQFLESDNQKYDLIIMDIFQSAVIPEKFQSAEFLTSLKNKLNPAGFVLYNRMNITDKDKSDNTNFHKVIQYVFPRMKKLPIKDNIVFISDKSHLL